MSSHTEPNELAERDCSTSCGSTWESNTVFTPRHYGVGTARGAKSVAGAAMMNAVLLLISGASCAGKTSVRTAIAADLEPAVTAVELRHLGAVPAPPTLEWRQRMAEQAVLAAIQLEETGRHLLLAGDPVAPGELVCAPSAPLVDIAVCLLDVGEQAQREQAPPTRRPRGTLRTPRRLRGLDAATRPRPQAYAARAEHRRLVGYAVVTSDGHACRRMANQHHRRLGDDKGGSESGCAAVGHRRHSGPGTGVPTQPYFDAVTGAGMSGCTDCRGCQPGGPKTKPNRSRHRRAARRSRAIATYSWVCSFQML